MNAFRIAATVLGLALACTALAQNPAIRATVETNANAIVLPSGIVGTLVLKPCDECAPVSLTASAATRYVIGDASVTFNEFRQEIERRPTAMLVVSYDGRTRALSRVRMSASRRGEQR